MPWTFAGRRCAGSPHSGSGDRASLRRGLRAPTRAAHFPGTSAAPASSLRPASGSGRTFLCGDNNNETTYVQGLPAHAGNRSATSGTMTITETIIVRQQGYARPYIKAGGRWYFIETKKSLLDDGIACMVAQTEDLLTDLDNPSTFSAIAPADPENGRPDPKVIPEATDDPEVVALARNFALTGHCSPS